MELIEYIQSFFGKEQKDVGLSGSLSLQTARLKKILLGFSFSAVLGLAYPIYNFYVNITDIKSHFSITLQSVPDILYPIGLEKDSFEKRLSFELQALSENMTIPGILPGQPKVLTTLQNIDANVNIEVVGKQFSMQPLISKIRQYLKREDIKIDIYLVLNGRDIVITLISERVGEKKQRKDVFSLDNNDISDIPSYIANIVLEIVTPIYFISNIGRDFPFCLPDCKDKIYELIYYSHLTTVSPPNWDNEIGKLAWVQFEYIRRTNKREISKFDLDELMPKVKEAANSSEDYELKMQAALLAHLLGDGDISNKLAESSIDRFVNSHYFNKRSDNKPCDYDPVELAFDAKVQFSILCTTYKYIHSINQLKIPKVHQYAAHMSTIRIINWTKGDPRVESWAGILWKKIDPIWSDSILKNAAIHDNGLSGPLTYGIFLQGNKRYTEAFKNFRSALLNVVSLGTDVDFLLSQIEALTDTTGFFYQRDLTRQCIQETDSNQAICIQMLAEALENIQVNQVNQVNTKNIHHKKKRAKNKKNHKLCT
ncbi:hypothetical protein ACH50O_03125 [Methylomonas sp. 2BW1-5-20]|uniref:hypothetical protein n=1 Tax=Methylomonas sp. 2BW1-5-20 TaxID=3376686 RepID=UPI00404FC9A4